MRLTEEILMDESLMDTETLYLTPDERLERMYYESPEEEPSHTGSKRVTGGFVSLPCDLVPF